jgi:hypothetical protein
MAMGAVMAKGRQRKDGKRTPSGQLSRAKSPISLSLVRGMIATKMIDGRFNTPFGLMALDDRITQAQFDAGMRFAEAERAYRAAIDSPPASPPAQDVNRLGGRPNEFEDEHAIRAKDRAILQWQTLDALLNSLERRSLNIVVVRQYAPEGYVQVMSLKTALDKLVRHWSGRR